MKQEVDTGTLLEDAGEAIGYLKIYLERQLQLAKLDAAERSAKMMAAMATAMTLGAFAMIFFCCLSIALGLLIRQLLEVQLSTAFFLLSGFYFLLGLILYFFRQRLFTNPILELVIKTLFTK